MSRAPACSETGQPSVKSVDDVITAFAADLRNGLTAQEAARRLAARAGALSGSACLLATGSHCHRTRRVDDRGSCRLARR